MTTFVLLHGAWHSAWCWRFVASALRHTGHNVYTPTLTGLGERAHLTRPEIDLKLHVQDVLALLEMEDLHDIVLLGHSYGGMVVTGVADRCAARIRRLSRASGVPAAHSLQDRRRRCDHHSADVNFDIPLLVRSHRSRYIVDVLAFSGR